MDTGELVDLFQIYMAPVPTPVGLTSREIVRRAIEFDHPPRIPYSFVDPIASDFLELLVLLVAGDPVAAAPAGHMVFDDWGVGWRSTGRVRGHAEVHPLTNLSALEEYEFPEALKPELWAAGSLIAESASAAGKYVVGPDPVKGIERLRGLVGFENLMMALYTDRERVGALLGRLADMTIEVVRTYAEKSTVHGFMTWEDWGLQTSLQINPQVWREVFKPHYARIVEAAHAGGMHYLLHCCGYIVDIIPDLIDIGVDVLQLDQPRLMGHERLASLFGGQICFWNCVDIQWSPRPEVTHEDIRQDVKEMVERFGPFGGGLIARHYPAWWDIGMTTEKNRAIYDAFMEFGCRQVASGTASSKGRC